MSYADGTGAAPSLLTGYEGHLGHESRTVGGLHPRHSGGGRAQPGLRAVLVAALLVAQSGVDALASERPNDRSPIATRGQESATATAFRSFLEPSVPENVRADVPGYVAATGRVTERLTIDTLLSPGGFERPRWRSFDHVGPRATVPRTDGARFVVAIDPGHGGSDPGAEGPNGLLEKHLTLDIARRIRLFLSEFDDIEVVLTRERDRGLSRRTRVAAVRESGADLFVSLHFNHLPQREITLVESFYAGPENIADSRARRRSALGRAADELSPELAFTRGSERFAEFAQRRVFDEVGRHNGSALDAGIKRDTLYVLTRSYTSGALIELTCLSNTEEAERLTDERYRDRLAAGLADAIREYRHSLETRPIDGAGA